MASANEIHPGKEFFLQLDAFVQRFEERWQSGDPPAIDDFLPKEGPASLRLAVLIELVHVDRERRLRAGETAEDYLKRYPELAANADYVKELLHPPTGSPSQAGNRGDAAPKTLPQQIGRYRVEKALGQGGFGVVYLAHDDQLSRPVAIKVPHRRLVARPEDAKAYLTEARIVANLDHPNIVSVHDVGSTEDMPFFIVSKYIEGSTLSQKIKEHEVSYGDATTLTATIAEALHYAHRKGLVHRDIKPGNIMIDKSGKAFVVDFGLALREENVGRGPKYAGTPSYMSPEQARGEGHRVDGRSDVFSLGVVFYEMLTGRRPFQADSRDELLERIATTEPRPPRQYDDKIPIELERICLRAMCRRASERYTTAKDMADDLHHFFEHSTEDDKRGRGPISAAADCPSSPPASTPALSPLPTPPSDSQLIKIVPKGLRSFDAHDADFFLELLPGPRDREGLPESIRFWKTRTEEPDAEKTFAVGLLCGPSGCGKSSLVKAGLLPRLSPDVITVYLEATAAETETRLLNGLRKGCPALPADLSAQETLTALRRGQGLPSGKKVLIVLDQFEQWLHAHKDKENTELVQTLRQCDGERVQCLVMVRDDFWMAVIRFMRELEIRLIEGQNSAAVDLFPKRHAEKVLAAFGRAFGVLPENAGRIGKEQRQFLEHAVSGLAQEGKVVCVRLALFAEMMKNKPWTPASLRAVGGTAGVGVTFLEETFSASAAPPEHRYHQKAARSVLIALLPESGSNIRGQMRSSTELLDMSGYANRLKDFDDLIRILDSEIRLITPTDPDGQGEEGRIKNRQQKVSDLCSQPHPSSLRYYQLTHDYLVHSLRDWLSKKQKETRRGRAELVLADRAGVWNARPENRQLPSLLQWANICLLSKKSNWTVSQKKMMRKAKGYFSVRMVAVTILLALLVWGGYEGHGRLKARALLEQLLYAQTTEVPNIVQDMANYRRWLDPLLYDAYAQAKAGKHTRKQLHASLALVPVDATQVAYLYSRLLRAEPDEVKVVRDALAPHKSELVDRLWEVVEKPAKGEEKQQQLRAAAALASYDPASQRWEKLSAKVAEDLVSVNAVYLGLWRDAFRPVKARLLSPLSVIFRDSKPELRSERILASNLLADYAADRPIDLVDLLLDADEKQFSMLYPQIMEYGDRSISLFLSEIDKVADRKIREWQGAIIQSDAPIKFFNGKSLAAKRFEVPFQAGKTYRITMDSKDMHAFLVLQDKTGKELAYTDGGGNLNALLVYTATETGTRKIYCASMKGTGSFILTIVEVAGEDAKEKLAKRQANAAVALLKMNQPERMWPLLKHSRDPRVRSYLIHLFGPLGVDMETVVKRLAGESDVTIRRALILSLGEFGDKDWPAGGRHNFLLRLLQLYRDDPDPGIHGAAEWVLRQWQAADQLKEIDKGLATGKVEGKRQWYVNHQGQTMVVIPGPVEFRMGSPLTEGSRSPGEHQHLKRINRTFAIATKAVTVAQFLRFDNDHDNFYGPRGYAPKTDCPIVEVSWYEAVAYCNWLSREEGLPPQEWCYQRNSDGKFDEGMQAAPDYLKRLGYRLPTEAEWEYSCRAGAVTSRYYGESKELLGKYAQHVFNSRNRPWPVGSLKPNDWGLFDMHGNVIQWCQETANPYPETAKNTPIDDSEDRHAVTDRTSRITRGSGFNSHPDNVRSAERNSDNPYDTDNQMGFRLARTFR